VADGAVINADGAGTGLTALTGTLVGGDAADDFTTGTVHGLIVEAVSREEVLHLVIAAGAGFVGVAGAVGVTVIDSDTNAWIGNADINQGGTPDADQSVYVNAANEARLTTLIVGAAGGFVGVGDSLAPVTLTVSNDGPETICYLQISPTTSTFWGADWLGADQTLAPDDSFTADLPPYSYDLRGLDCDVNELFVDQQDVTADMEVTY